MWYFKLSKEANVKPYIDYDMYNICIMLSTVKAGAYFHLENIGCDYKSLLLKLFLSFTMICYKNKPL